MSSADSMDLSSVRKRFTDSTDALERIRERLQAVLLAEEVSATSASSLEAAAGGLTSTASQLSELTDQLSAAVRSTEAAMAAAKRLLEQTDLTDLPATLERVAGQQSQANDASSVLSQRIESLTQTFENRLAQVEAQLSVLANAADERARTAEARATAAESRYQELRAALPPKVAKKLEV